MQPCKIAVAASQNAQADPQLVGVAPTWILALINLLLPGIPALFTSCLGPTPTPATVKENLEAAYDEESETYSHQAIGPVWHQARVTSRKNKNPITIQQAQAIAQHTLDAAREGTDGDVQEALALPQTSN